MKGTIVNPNLSSAQFPVADNEESSPDGGYGSVDERQGQANVGNPTSSQNANLSVQLDPARVASMPAPAERGRSSPAEREAPGTFPEQVSQHNEEAQ